MFYFSKALSKTTGSNPGSTFGSYLSQYRCGHNLLPPASHRFATKRVRSLFDWRGACPGWHWVSVLLTRWARVYERRPLTLGVWYWYAKPSPDIDNAEENIPRQREAEANWTVLSRIVGACRKEKLLQVWDRDLANGQ